MEYPYPPTSPLRPVPFDYANLGLIALCVLTGIVLVIYYRHPKQLWLVSLFVVLPVLGGCILPFLPRRDPAFTPDYQAWVLLLMLSGVGLFIAIVRGIGWTGAFSATLFGACFIALILPATRQTKRPARRLQCLNNIRNLMIAVQNYASVNEGQPPPPGFQHDDLSWRVAILPLIDQVALYRAYHRDKPWDDPANDEFAKQQIKVFQCPQNSNQLDAQGRYYTAYAYFTGPGTAFDGDKSATLDDIGEADGLTQTMLIGEACGANIVWNEPRDIDVGTRPAGVNLPGKTPGTSAGWLSSYHIDTVNVAFVDGSCRSISKDIDPKVLKALTTVDGKDTPSPNAW